MVDEVSPLLLIRSIFQKVLHKQGFIAGGGNLCNKDHIIRVDWVLMLVGQIGVQGVTHLVGQSKLAVQCAGIVQQHVGMDGGASGISTAALALILVNVDPAVVKALLQNGPVVLAQRSQGIVDSLLRLLIGDMLVNAGQEWGVNVIEMQFFNAQQLLAQADIAVHTGKLLVNRFDQVVVNRHRHIGAVQRGFQRGAVFSGIGEEFQLLILAVQNGRRRIFEGSKAVIEVIVGAFPQGAVRAFL